ncbi:MAG: hypothetical protein EOM50_09855 [Erysipelotrichia bacterium]|nr:hypothetical protein [Erysipelotrichia bacterium]
MILNLFKTNDSDNVINKTITNKLAININLKRDIDVISPRLVIRDSASININAFNYCQIEELNRFYFIRSINNMGGNLWEVICECDVLETYKADIISSRARYYRNIRNGDYYQGTIDTSSLKTISKHISNKGFEEGTALILTTIGG